MKKYTLRGRWRLNALITTLAAACALALAAASPAVAQSSDGKVQLAQGFFDRLFGPQPGGGMFAPPEPPKPVDSTRAPPPRKPDTPPTTTVMVIGDSLADWLAYGLEDAYADTPEMGVIRKHRTGSGLIRYDLRNEMAEWATPIREMLAAEKPNYVVMMVGLNDRQAFRVKQGAARAATPQPEKPQNAEQDQENPEQPATEESQRARTPGVYEFRSERWEELYVKRIDDTIAALKSHGAPVFWVGLPALRGAKATSDASYLNELFRARAEKAGINYVDVWDGFVDDQGRFTLQGPDYEGQSRRLRTADGIHFTKSGARKLAHYLEREISRVQPMETPQIPLPGAEQQVQTPSTKPGGATARPLVGLAVPLALYAAPSEELIGTPSNRGEPPTQAATVVLLKGDAIDAPAGRADDFAWPRRAIAAFGTDPVVTSTTMPVPMAQLPPPPPEAEPRKTAARQAYSPGSPQAQQPRVLQVQPRPAFNPFSFFGGLFR